MLFNSLEFLLFLPLVVMGYFILPQSARRLFLLAASYYFYACWRVEFLFLILFSTAIDYWAALQMAGLSSRRERLPYLWISLITNLGILFLFKYANFFGQSLQDVLQAVNIMVWMPELKIILPVGISFYTFQTMGYTLDVYRGYRTPERDPIVFALYVSFFPQLVAGPIERSSRLIPQLKQHHQFTIENVMRGGALIIWGFFKKAVISDRIAVTVEQVYRQPELYPANILILATYLGAFMIYCDFSGYTDIARGTAQLFGINLMENFRRPFLSASLAEWWQRWHISMSSWFRDYLFIPLNRNFTNQRRVGLTVIIVLALMGFWHGANWTFIVWGFAHGLLLIMENWSRPGQKWIWNYIRSRSETGKPGAASWLSNNGLKRLRRLTGILITFHLFLAVGIIFISPSLDIAGTIYWRILSLAPTGIQLPDLAPGLYELSIALTAIIVLMAVEVVQEKSPKWDFLTQQPSWFRLLNWTLILYAIILFGEFDLKPFYYFQF